MSPREARTSSEPSTSAAAGAGAGTCRPDGNYALRVSRMVVRSLQVLVLAGGLTLFAGCGDETGMSRPNDGPSKYLKLDETSDIDEMDAYCAAEPDDKACADR